MDLNSKSEQYYTIRAALIALHREFQHLYPLEHFILAVESRDKSFLTMLMVTAWELPISLFPLNPDLPQGYKNALLQQTGSKLLLLEDHHNYVAQKSILRSEFLSLADLEKVKKPIDVNDRQIKLIIATSGSTNVPKAVCLSRANIQAHVTASNQRVVLSESDNWLNCLPLFHVGGAMIVYRCLLTECSMHLWDTFQAERIVQAITDNKISHISLVPAMLYKLLSIAVHISIPKTLKSILIGGSTLTKDLYEQAIKNGWPLCVSYGSSETCSHIATNCHYVGEYETGLTGRPLLNVEIDLDGNPAENFDGQIKMRGPMIMEGYAQPDYTLGHGLQDGWFISQDLGRFDHLGRLQVLGRIDDVINSGSEIIHPQVIENELLQCPGITDAAVLGVADQIWGEKVVLVFCGIWQKEQVQLWCSEKLQHSFKIREAVKLDHLPRNPMGKIQRNELKALFSDS